jgi:hypothetical protein
MSLNTCPNPNNPDWKKLVELLGEENAYREYVRYGGEIPNPDLYESRVVNNQSYIKPGVEELFDSNPELANQVYEALGFNKSTFDTKGISLSEETSIGWMFIQLNNKKIGRIKFVNNGEKGQLGLSIEIDEEYQNKGYGQVVHILMADLAKRDYKSKLYSDYQNSIQEIQLLNALAKKGYAEKIGNIGKTSEEYPDTFTTEERAFRIKTSDEIQQITLQQKQQALQLYSQYLNTIFPDSKVKDIVYHGSYAEKIDKFSKDILGRTSLTGFLPKGFYFTNQKYVAATYTAPKDVYNRAVWSSLLNALKGVKGERDEYIQAPISFEKLLSYIGQSNNEKEFIIDYRDGKLEDSFGGAAELGLFLPPKEDTELYLKLLRSKDLKAIENQRDKYSDKEGSIFSVILNIKNPLNKTSATGSITTINLEGRTTGEKKETLQKELKNSDGLIINDIRDSSDYKSKRNIKYNENIEEQTYVVFEPEQIHILGSKQDIEGFKEFVNNKNVFLKNSDSSTEGMSSIELLTVANTFSKKLGVGFKIINEEEANKAGLNKSTRGAYDPKTNTVLLIEGRTDFSTALHEFTHPFVEYIYHTNKTLYKALKASLLNQKGINALSDYLRDNGYDEKFINDSGITELGWRELLTTNIEKVSGSLVNNNIDNSFLRNVRVFWKKIKEFLSSIIHPDFKNLKDEDVPNITFRDIALFMLDPDAKIDLHKAFVDSGYFNDAASSMMFKKANSSYQTSLANQVASYKKRTGNSITDAQNKVLNILLQNQNLEVKDKNYIDPENNQTYTRVTSYIKNIQGPNGEPNYFDYNSEEDYGVEARAYGNQIDKLVEYLIQGADKTTAISNVIDYYKNNAESQEALAYTVNEEVLDEVYDFVKNLLDTKYKNYIVIPQAILADNSKLIAGRTDIILISPEGRIKIIDVKTAKYSSLSEEYRKQYTFNGKKSSSKKETYTAQLSVYKALASSMGLKFEDSDLAILPIYIKTLENKKVTEAKVENEYSVFGYSYIIDSFEKGSENIVNDFYENSDEGKLVNKIKVILQKRLKDIEKMPESSKKYYSKKQIDELIDTLNQAESIKKLTEFVNVLYDQFTDKLITKKDGSKTKIFGLASQASYVANKLNSRKISEEEAIKELLHIKNINDLYSPVLDDIKYILNQKEEEVSSDMKVKLNTIANSISEINVIYKKDIVENLANILSTKISKEANKQAQIQLETLKKRLDSASTPKEKEKRQKEYDFALRKLKSEEGITRGVILNSLKYGSSEDIAFIDMLATPAAQSSNELIATFTRLYKDKMEDARQSLIEFERNSAKALNNFGKEGMDNPAKFNEGIYEEVNVFDELDEEGNPKFVKRMEFVSPIDMNAFYSYQAAYKKALNTATPEQAKALKKNYNETVFIKRPAEDIFIINPITGEKVVIEKGINSLIEHQRKLLEDKVITQEQFDNYVEASNNDLYGKNLRPEFTMINPKRFPNKKYQELSGKKKDYYNYLVASYFKSQERLPHKMRYRLPSIHKSGYDSIRENGFINYLKYEKEQLQETRPEDIKLYGESGKNIPLIFNFRMDAKDVSLDLIQSIVMYEAESLEYQAKSEVASVGESLLSIVKENIPYKTDGSSNPLIDSFAEKAGVKDEFLKYQKIFGDNRIAMLLASYIDAQIYGKLNIPSDMKFLGMKVDKLVDGMMSFASKTQVGGNPIGSVANYLQATIQANIDAAAKDAISDSSWLKSRVIYDKSIPDFVKDFNAGYSVSKIGQLVDLYDPMQGEYKDAAGRRISKSAWKKMWNTNTWFFLQHQGEHAVQVRTMIAMMLDTKVTTKDGKVINLYDAYELGPNDVIKLKDGIKLEGNLSANGKISRDFQAKLHALNKRLHGVYNTQDKIHAERFLIGRVMTMYKKFLVPGFKRRYKAIGYDQEYGGITEGYYITFKNKLLNDTKELSRFLIGIDTGYFTEFEKQNLRRARREILIVALTGTMVMLIQAMMEAADDDEKRYYRHLLFLTMRLNNELGIFGTFGDPQNLGLPSVGELYKTIKNPMPVVSVTDRFQKLLKQMTSPFEVYERDSGIWEKGDSKLWAAFLKFWGLNGVNFDPENSIKYMNMTTK